MIIKAGYLLLFFLFILPPSSVLAWSGKVIGVADADSIKVLRNNEPIRVRLYEIDTPETFSDADPFVQKIKNQGLSIN